jgi:hypothetical protein
LLQPARAFDYATVKLHFDDRPLKTVKHWAKRGCREFDLRGSRIFRSSRESYHVVFETVRSLKRRTLKSCAGLLSWLKENN